MNEVCTGWLDRTSQRKQNRWRNVLPNLVHTDAPSVLFPAQRSIQPPSIIKWYNAPISDIHSNKLAEEPTNMRSAALWQLQAMTDCLPLSLCLSVWLLLQCKQKVILVGQVGKHDRPSRWMHELWGERTWEPKYSDPMMGWVGCLIL